jgi:hypothetical protein
MWRLTYTVNNSYDYGSCPFAIKKSQFTPASVHLLKTLENTVRFILRVESDTCSFRIWLMLLNSSTRSLLLQSALCNFLDTRESRKRMQSWMTRNDMCYTGVYLQMLGASTTFISYKMTWWHENEGRMRKRVITRMIRFSDIWLGPCM